MGKKVTFFVSSTPEIASTSVYTCSCLSLMPILVFCLHQELYCLCMCYGRYVLVTKSRDFFVSVQDLAIIQYKMKID